MADEKLSVSRKLGNVVLPTLTTCKLYVTGWPTPTCPPDGERMVLFITTPGTPGADWMIAVALVLSLASVTSV